ncbi:MAG: phosphate ABC transporter permease subunit PstC [Chloroflexota bacterium]|nr:phosphate ABC transporter permease subunit PstC [Chloroflexota bacterium]
MATVSKRVGLDITKRRMSYGDTVFALLMMAGSTAVVLTLGAMIYVLTLQSWDSITHFGFGFFTSETWNPVTNHFGALSAIYGTVASSIVALIIAVPIAVGVALFLSEVAPGPVRVPASFLIEMLAAVPSVVFGLWGLFVLEPRVHDWFEPALSATLGWTPFFNGPQLGLGVLAAGIILAIMILPIIAAISRDVLRAVPQSQREAALALGATKWETIWFVVLPYARPGITGAVILGLGRAVGETMAVLLLIGNSYNIDISLFAPGTTLASSIASNLGEASDLYRAALIELGLILLGITLLINVAARILVWRISTHAGGGHRY